MKKIIVLISVLFFLSCTSDDEENVVNVITVTVSDITVEGGTITWTPPSNLQSGSSVAYKIVLFGDVIAEDLIATSSYTFTGLSSNVIYTGAVFALDSFGNETFAEFSFTTLQTEYYNGVLTISTQEEVDNFYYSWATALVIDGANITDLSGLETLEYVERFIEIKNTSIENLNGLVNVQTDINLFGPTSPLPYLKIENNSQLQAVDGIADFSEKSTSVRIINSPLLNSLNGIRFREEATVYLASLSITDLSPFSGYTSFEGLSIRECNALTNLNDLTNIQNIKGLILTDLLNVNFNDLSNVTSSITIQNCNSLSSLSELGSVNSVVLNLNSCDGLVDLNGLNSSALLNRVNITDCENLTNLSGLGNIQSLYSLGVINCDNLIDLSGLDAIQTLDELHIEECHNLVNLNGIENTVTGLLQVNRIKIKNNSSLTSLNGFNSTNTGDNIYISIINNPNLTSFCGIRSWAESNTIYFGGLGNDNYEVISNAYNPTVDQLRSDECSQ